MIEPNYVYRAKVINVVDGDTIDVQIDAGFYLTITHRLRLLRINAPEMNSSDPEIRAKALAAKRRLQFIFGVDPHVTLRTVKADAFGRFLAEVWSLAVDEQVNLNDLLLKEGLVTLYEKK